jgi:hypothetical protein
MCECSPSAATPWHVLPPSTPALAVGAPLLCRHRPGPPGTLHVLGPDGGIAVRPDDGSRAGLDVGRSPDAAVRLGAGDPSVSRRQGVLVGGDRRWVLRNTGRLPMHVPDADEPLLTGHEVALAPGFHPVLVRSGRRTHVLEVLITATGDPSAPAPGSAATAPRPVRTLSERERLVLTALFAPYLRRDDEPRPVTAAAVAEELTELTGAPWRPRQVGAVTDDVRLRLHRQGVPGLLAGDDVPPDRLRHRLYRALAVDSPTLTPRDLDRLDGPAR